MMRNYLALLVILSQAIRQNAGRGKSFVSPFEEIAKT